MLVFFRYKQFFFQIKIFLEYSNSENDFKINIIMKLITYPAIVKLLLCKLFTNLINIYYIKIPVHNTLKDYVSMPIGITGI